MKEKDAVEGEVFKWLIEGLATEDLVDKRAVVDLLNGMVHLGLNGVNVVRSEERAFVGASAV